MAKIANRSLTTKRGEAPSKPEPNVLRGSLKTGQTKKAREAELMVEGLAMNALVGLAFSSKLGDLDLTECFAQILDRAREVSDRKTKSQEAILASQVVSLNALYTDLALIARQNISNAVIFERLMRLALKAQSNCRATADTLSAIQNPPTVFASQANFASGPQQINNSSAVSVARANSRSEPNELLEANGESLDTAKTLQAIRDDQEMATVGTIDGPADDNR